MGFRGSLVQIQSSRPEKSIKYALKKPKAAGQKRTGRFLFPDDSPGMRNVALNGPLDKASFCMRRRFGRRLDSSAKLPVLLHGASCRRRVKGCRSNTIKCGSLCLGYPIKTLIPLVFNAPINLHTVFFKCGIPGTYEKA